MANTRLKIKKDDEVLVLKGKDRGKKGKIIRVIPLKRRVVIEGVNMRKKHIRPRKAGEKGNTVFIPASLSVANVQLICPSCSKPSRIGYKIEGKVKVRVCKKCQNHIG